MPPVRSGENVESRVPRPPVKIVTDPQGASKMAVVEQGVPAEKKGTPEDPDYQKAREQMQPLSPSQIEDLVLHREEVDKALASRQPPKSTTMTIPVTMRPGDPPKEILLSDNYVTTLTLTDATGAPWPVSKALPGNSSHFSVELPEKPGNIVVITPQFKYAASNLMLLLEGASSPVMLALRTTREMAYYNANLVVDERGPMAPDVVVEEPALPVDSPVMRRILDGTGSLVPGVREVAISGLEGTTAYVHAGALYLRTPYSLTSPGWESSIRGDRMRVYKLAPTSVISVAAPSGRIVDLLVGGETILDAAIAANATARDPHGVSHD